MAYYAALVSLLELLKEICHHDKYPDTLLDNQQIASLYEKFSHLQNLMGDYSPRDQEVAGCLERRVRDASYHARNIVEYQISNETHQRYINLKRAFQQLEKVNEEVDTIVEDFMKIKEVYRTLAEHLQLNSCVSNDRTTGGASKVQAESGTSTTVIFDEHLMTTIKGQLCGESYSREVVSIVGMGGLGKTTLARSIFDDKLIDYHFDCRAWVSISQVYHLEKVLQDILSSLKEDGRLGGSPEVLYLKGMRYLIIIDDMWDTNVWDDVKRILPDDSNGSRVIITTRLSNVAVYASKFGFIHQMKFLNEDQSWILLQKKVFAEEHCPNELEVVGKLIANNCRGLPLALVVIAGVLSKVNKTRHVWDKIAGNVSSTDFDQNDEHFSKILSLSYNHLPHYLKPCFLHMGGFQEDSEISVSKLIQLWVAEGFLKPVESKSLEQVGEEYLEDLISRNLVLVTATRYNGKFKLCIIHDLLRDLSKKRACYENFLHVLDGTGYCCPEDIRNVRRLYIHHGYYASSSQELESASHNGYYSNYLQELESAPYIHSFLCLHSDFWDDLPLITRGFKLLRILDALNIFIKSFPFEILELFHLRFLALPGSALFTLPSISKLQNLQTLIIGEIPLFPKLLPIQLPCEIWKMPHLRHVIVYPQGLSPVLFLGQEAPALINLQTLSTILNFKFTNEAIDMIPNLQKLKVIYKNDSLEKWLEYGLNNFIRLHQLEVLDILFECHLKMVDPLPDSFAFPTTLIELSLAECRLPWKDMTVVGSLPNLQVLRLIGSAFVGEEWEPLEGEFPRLKFLNMSMLDLRYWRMENTNFLCLEHLVIKFCTRLNEIPSGIGEIPTLQLIEVHYYNLPVHSAQRMQEEKLVDSALRIQEEQRDLGNDVLQVHVYPN